MTPVEIASQVSNPVYVIKGNQIIILAVLVLYLGSYVTKKIDFISKNNIPVSVTGGVICSLLVALLAGLNIVKLDFDLTLRSLLLLIFFATIGLNAKLKSLLQGGKALVFLVIACAIFLILQNVVGVLVAMAFGKEAIFGLFGGSISLAGGHGTAIAWGEIAVKNGINGASEFGIACATFGLIIGGLIGGPIASRIIKRKKLQTNDSELCYSNQEQNEVSAKRHNVTVEDILGTIFALALCIGLGDSVNRYLFENEIRLPGFLTAMMVGVVITNVADKFKAKVNHDGIDLIGGVSLQLFLTMSLMSMDLLSLADSAGLLMVTMVFQVSLIAIFAVTILFRLMGKDYDAAMIVGGFLGLGLGATPVAIASMDAVSKKYGPSAKAILIVPLVGAFFIDLLNATTIQLFIRFLS